MTDYQVEEYSTRKIGPLIRLGGIRTDQLPPVPGLEGMDGNIDRLTQFLASLIREAVPFIDSAAPREIGDGDGHTSTGASASTHKRKIECWKLKGTKSYRPELAAKVELFERVIGPRELEEAVASIGKEKGRVAMGAGETWVCRRSVHEDRKEKGTASWNEFRECFKVRHAETEVMFTPSVVMMKKRVIWDCGSVPPQKIPTSPESQKETTTTTYSNFTLCIIESRHRIGKPLKDRTFPILQMTCSKTMMTTGGGVQEEHPEFLVISVTIPDYFSTSTTSFEQSDIKPKDTVVASYASIERIRKIPPTPSKENPTTTAAGDNSPNQKIEWLMALTSNAGGVLPQWIQNLAVPGQIAKDVPLFLGWIAKEREKATAST